MQILKTTDMKGYEKAKELGRDETLDLLLQKEVVGRGGAAFPTAKKWKFAKNAESDTKYVICNADEGEPGTFKDKFIIKNNAKTMIEGMLIAAYVIGAKEGFIYLRGEYEYLRERLEKQIAEVTKDTGITIEIVRGAGAYVCGEETAIIQSIMGKRGHSQYKPPFPPVEGLWGKPTVVNNVETLTTVTQAILFDDYDPNVRLFSISGNVKRPGVYEFPLGVKAKDVISTVGCDNVKALSFGCFGGLMPYDPEAEITIETICKHSCFHGAYTIIVIDETTNIVDINLSIGRFYTYESCGKCTPCREGTIRMLNLLKKVRRGEAGYSDLHTLEDFANHVQETSLCGLGQTAGQHILTGLKHFRKDYEVYIHEN